MNELKGFWENLIQFSFQRKKLKSKLLDFLVQSPNQEQK